jgi:hypothetical protein
MWKFIILVLVLSSQGFSTDRVEDTYKIKLIEWYAGLGFTTVQAKCTDNCKDITYGILGKVGYNFNEYVALEGRAIKTNWEYEQQKIEHMGLFVKPIYPLKKDMSLYGLLGYGKVETGNKIVFDENGFAWGIGLNYYFGEHKESKKEEYDSKGFGLFIDYERLLQKSDSPDFDSLNIGVIYDF